MKELYLFLAKHQKPIKNLFFLSYTLTIAAILAGTLLYEQSQEIRVLYRSIGEKTGQISIILLVLTLIPGILDRIGLLRSFESLLTLFRRQFGVLAFYFAALHIMYISWIRTIARGDNPFSNIFKYQQTGTAAIAIFLLLWVTSNDLSMKLMGKWWKYLQRLSYLSVIALIFHVFAAGSELWLVLSGILAVEAISWITVFLRRK